MNKLLFVILLTANLFAQTAVFPNGVATTQQLMQAGNNLGTTLTAPANATATTLFMGQ